MAQKPLYDRPSFFKVMIGDFTTNLCIPPHFIKQQGDKLGLKSVIRNCRGSSWYVKIRREDGYLFLEEGWESFLSDNKISFGDFLVFFFDGCFGFDVKIYGKTGCEKENAAPYTDQKMVEARNTTNDVWPKPNVTKKRKAYDFLKENNLCVKVMRSVKGIEDEAVLKAACSFLTSYPCFISTCRRSRLYDMNLPKELVRKYDLYEKKLMILQDNTGKSWTVKVYRQCDGQLRLGWHKFRREQHLKYGDVCVFEFIEGGNPILVHIFRREEQSEKSVPKSLKKSVAESVPKSSKRSLPKFSKRSFPESGNSLQSEVLKEANSFKSKHPKFVALWKMCRFYYMPIPKELVKKLGVRSNARTIVFDPCGRAWPVDIVCRTYGRVEMGIGWSKFIKGNNLTTGDAIVVEFLGGSIDAIQVHIFRKGETKTSAACGIPEESHDHEQKPVIPPS